MFSIGTYEKRMGEQRVEELLVFYVFASAHLFPRQVVRDLSGLQRHTNPRKGYTLSERIFPDYWIGLRFPEDDDG